MNTIAEAITANRQDDVQNRIQAGPLFPLEFESLIQAARSNPQWVAPLVTASAKGFACGQQFPKRTANLAIHTATFSHESPAWNTIAENLIKQCTRADIARELTRWPAAQEKVTALCQQIDTKIAAAAIATSTKTTTNPANTATTQAPAVHLWPEAIKAASTNTPIPPKALYNITARGITTVMEAFRPEDAAAIILSEQPVGTKAQVSIYQGPPIAPSDLDYTAQKVAEDRENIVEPPQPQRIEFATDSKQPHFKFKDSTWHLTTPAATRPLTTPGILLDTTTGHVIGIGEKSGLLDSLATLSPQFPHTVPLEKRLLVIEPTRVSDRQANMDVFVPGRALQRFDHIHEKNPPNDLDILAARFPYIPFSKPSADLSPTTISIDIPNAPPYFMALTPQTWENLQTLNRDIQRRQQKTPSTFQR